MLSTRRSTRRSASVIAYSDIKLVEIYNQALGRATTGCQQQFDKVFLEFLASRLAEMSEKINQKENAGGRLPDAFPAGNPESILHDKPPLNGIFSSSNNNVASCPVASNAKFSYWVCGKAQALQLALIGLVIVDGLYHLLSLLK